MFVNDKPARHAQARSGHRPNPPEADAGRDQAPARRQSHSRHHFRARAGSTIRRAPSTTPPTRSCRRPAPSRSTFCAITSGWSPGKDGDQIVYDTAPLNGPVAAGRYHRRAAHGHRLGVEVHDDRRSHSRRARNSSSATTSTSCATGRRGGSTSSRGANCTTTAWRSSRPTSRRASSSISIC